MRPERFTEEQIIGMLNEQEAGAKTVDVCRKHGISSATFYKFKAKYGGRDVPDALRGDVTNRDKRESRKIGAPFPYRRRRSIAKGSWRPNSRLIESGLLTNPGGRKRV